MQLKFSKELYSKTALIKAAYSFTNRSYIRLDTDHNYYTVDIEVKPGYKNISDKEFENEMLCQSARYEVYKQTKAIRELLIARAMASTVIEIPHDTVINETDDSVDMNDILTDWFENHDESKS